MSHTANANEFLEVSGDELRAIVRDDSRPGLGELFACPLNDRFDLGFGHARADFPVRDVPAATVEQAAKIEERAANIDVRNIDVPVLVRTDRLLKPRSFLGRLAVVGMNQVRLFEHAIDAGGTHGDNVLVEHHEGQKAVAFKGILCMKVDDGLFLPVLKPAVARDVGVVFVGQAIASFPVMKLAGGKAHPGKESRGGDLGTLGPIADVIDELVANIVGDPGPVQRPPRLFFSWTCSSMSSATTSFLSWIFSRKRAMVRRWAESE